MLQVRISESLAILPFIDPAAVPGLFVGCLLANLASEFGLWDIVGGSLITLVAAYLTMKAPSYPLALVPPIVLNALGVSAYLSLFLPVGYWLLVTYILAGQVLAVGLLGTVLYLALRKVAPRLFVSS